LALAHFIRRVIAVLGTRSEEGLNLRPQLLLTGYNEVFFRRIPRRPELPNGFV
jgi:hypothetical protein